MSTCNYTEQRDTFTLGEVVRKFGQEYVDNYNVSGRGVKILSNIGNCRTAALGGQLISCSCGYQNYVYYCCGDGNCPQCQGIKRELWMDKMAHHLLPVKHYHVIFTIPHQFNEMAYYNQKKVYNALFQSAWKSIKQVIGKGMTGMVATLHTWGANLSHHPHLHCIVSSGKLLGNKWVEVSGASKRFLCDSKELRHKFKDNFLGELAKLIEEEALFIPHLEATDKMDYLVKTYCSTLSKKWNVRIETPVLGVQQIIEYLGRYVSRVAISNSSIQNITQTHVTLKYKQYQKQKKGQPAPIGTIDFEGPAFIQRFMQHILPSYFQRVRYYGVYSAPAKSKRNLAYKSITNSPQKQYCKPLKRQLLKKMLGTDPDVCPDCGLYQSFSVTGIPEDHQIFFFIKPKWHNVHIKLRQQDSNIAA